MKSKKALMNIMTDGMGKAITLILGIIIPKLYIEYFGSEVNGLLSSLSGIFVYLSLLEAGVGGASVQALYLPLVNKEQDKINGILVATNQFYRRTGLYFFACVAILSFTYPVVIKSNLNFNTLVIIILLSAIPSFLRFFIQGKYTILLNADNRAYILNIVTTIFNIITNLMKIILILLGENILKVQISFAFISILQVAIVRIYVKRKYPYIDLTVRPDAKGIAKKKNVMVHEISSAVFYNLDTLLLSFFCGLKVVSVYTIYNMIFVQTGFILKSVSSGVTASFGQIYFEDRLKFNKYFSYFEILYQTMVFAVFLTAGILITPFLELYTRGITDIPYLNQYLPILFLTISILNDIRWPGVMAISIAGHFKETQGKALLEMFINLVLSFVLVCFIGIYGVLLGTIVALCYRSVDIILYSHKHILKSKSDHKVIAYVINVVITIILYYIEINIKLEVTNYVEFFIMAAFMLMINMVVYATILFLSNKNLLINLSKRRTAIESMD